MERNSMGLCKCGLSDAYPECNGTHNATKNESLRKAILDAYKKWESDQSQGIIDSRVLGYPIKRKNYYV